MQHAVHGHTGDWAQGLLHAKRMYTSQQWPHESYTEKMGRDDLAHGHTGDWAQGLLHAKRMYTSQQWPHESYTDKMGAGWFRAFFEQEHLSRIGVEKPPKSSRPAFSRVYCPPGPCANSGTDRQDTRPTNSTAETPSVERAGGRKEIFFQPANMQHAVHGHTGDWAQGLLHAKRMYTSQQWPHESYTEKMGAGWFSAWTHWGLSPGPSACEADVHIPAMATRVLHWENGGGMI